LAQGCDTSLKNLFSLLTGKKPLFNPGGPPAHIGDYSVVREIGVGATSNVYLGIHKKTLVSVAIKLLSKECNSDIHRQMFRTEASLCGRMNHPNIVHLYEANLDAEEGAYLVMEYIEGKSLDKFARYDNLLHMDAAIDSIGQSAKALRYASGLGIIHRDVKPDNIIRTSTGLVKLTDFGCAITNEPDAAPPIPVAGSVSYMSPEQITGKPLNHQSDMYSLGAVFYRLLTGYYTFEADSVETAVQQILNHPHIPINDRRRGIPKELSDLIDRSLRKKPEDRHANWDEFIQELREAQEAIRSRYDYDLDMLRGFSDATLALYLTETRELAARFQTDQP
jgi:serine/threonine protein kinase